MPEIMEPNLGQSRPLQHSMKLAEDAVRGGRSAAVGRVDHPGAAARFFPLLFQNGGHVLRQWQRPIGILGFQRRLHDLSFNPGHLPLDLRLALFQIDVRPLEAQQFPPSQSCRQIQIVQLEDAAFFGFSMDIAHCLGAEALGLVFGL